MSRHSASRVLMKSSSVLEDALQLSANRMATVYTLQTAVPAQISQRPSVDSAGRMHRKTFIHDISFACKRCALTA